MKEQLPFWEKDRVSPTSPWCLLAYSSKVLIWLKAVDLRHGTGFAINLNQCSNSPRLATENEETAVSSSLG